MELNRIYIYIYICPENFNFKLCILHFYIVKPSFPSLKLMVRKRKKFFEIDGQWTLNLVFIQILIFQRKRITLRFAKFSSYLCKFIFIEMYFTLASYLYLLWLFCAHGTENRKLTHKRNVIVSSVIADVIVSMDIIYNPCYSLTVPLARTLGKEAELCRGMGIKNAGRNIDVDWIEKIRCTNI